MRTVFFCLVSLIMISLTASAQTSTPKSIEDYYYLLPQDYFLCDEADFTDSRDARKKAIILSDISNGYLTAKTANGTLYVVMFKDKTAKVDHIALYLNCGLGCMCNVFDFLNYNAESGWTPASGIMPWEEIEKYLVMRDQKYSTETFPIYTLPQYGTTIKARDAADDSPLFDLKWSGQKFQMVLY